MNNFWVACLGRFQEELSAQQFNTWIKPLHYKIDEQSLTLFAPNRFVQQWVKDKFLSRVVDFAKETLPHPIEVNVVLLESYNDDNIKSIESFIDGGPIKAKSKEAQSIVSKVVDKSAPKEPVTKKHKISEHSGLNPAFNFNNLVTGKANQLARAAALQIAENPGNTYNPLFIYGGGGAR